MLSCKRRVQLALASLIGAQGWVPMAQASEPVVSQRELADAMKFLDWTATFQIAIAYCVRERDLAAHAQAQIQQYQRRLQHSADHHGVKDFSAQWAQAKHRAQQEWANAAQGERESFCTVLRQQLPAGVKENAAVLSGPAAPASSIDSQQR